MNRVTRTDDGGDVDAPEGCPTIFTHPGWGCGKRTRRVLEERELTAAIAYVLLNCEEVEPYIGYEYINQLSFH